MTNPHGKKMIYPYGILGKLQAFPFAPYLKARPFRYIAVSFGICYFYMFYPFDRAVNSEANVKYWIEKRAAESVDIHAPLKEP